MATCLRAVAATDNNIYSDFGLFGLWLAFHHILFWAGHAMSQRHIS